MAAAAGPKVTEGCTDVGEGGVLRTENCVYLLMSNVMYLTVDVVRSRISGPLYCFSRTEGHGSLSEALKNYRENNRVRYSFWLLAAMEERGCGERL